MSNIDEATKQPALDALLNLDLRAVKAINPADLSFIIVNETIALVPYRQAAFFTVSAVGVLELTTASGLVSVAEKIHPTLYGLVVSLKLSQEYFQKKLVVISLIFQKRQKNLKMVGRSGYLSIYL